MAFTGLLHFFVDSMASKSSKNTVLPENDGRNNPRNVHSFNMFDIWNCVGDNYDVLEASSFMEITQEEKDMLGRIVINQYTGGAYKRATFIDKVCRNKADRAMLDALCKKGLAEKGLGGTVAGDVYWACWLTQKGKDVLGTE